MNPQESNPNPNINSQNPDPSQVNTGPEPTLQNQLTPQSVEQGNSTPDTGTDTLGILSLVSPFVGMSLIGLILGIVGLKKARNEGRSTTLSKVGIILNAFFVLIITVLVIAVVFIGISNNDNESGSESSAAFSSMNTDAAVQKADRFIEIQKNSNPLNPSNEDFEQSSELDNYAKFIDQPNLSKEERLAEAFKIGTTISTYYRLFSEGDIERTSTEIIDNSEESVLVKYRGENPSSNVFSGPYEFSVYVAYIGGAWRIVDFQVEDL